MKRIRFKDSIRSVAGCRYCPFSGEDGPDGETWAVCRATDDHEEIIDYAYEEKAIYPYWCPLEDE